MLDKIHTWELLGETAAIRLTLFKECLSLLPAFRLLKGNTSEQDCETKDAERFNKKKVK